MTAKTHKNKKLIIILSVILGVILILISSFFIFIKVGEWKLKKELVSNETIDDVDDFDIDADIHYNGKSYYYNKDLVNILVMGIDKKDEANSPIGQADAIFLISLNTENHKITVFPISRNTITDIDVFDINGEKFSTEKKQICLSYAYGLDDKQASINCLNSVSNLLYGIPINNYYTLKMEAVGEIINSVGNFDIKLIEEVPEAFPGKKVGETVTITRYNAISYLRARGERTNEMRFTRQKDFIKHFVVKAKSSMSKNWNLPVKIFNNLSKYSVTNIKSSSVAYLASEAFKADFKMVNIPGKAGSDGEYETFEADDDALYDLVINSFYSVK